MQVTAVPEQSPPQPENSWPVAGVAVRVTDVADAKLAVQLAPQSMPPGCDLVTPLPVLVTVKLNVVPVTGVKLADTLVAAAIVTEQLGSVPAQALPQPLNTKPVAALAIKVTVVPSATVALQAIPQSIAIAAEATEPEPVVATVTS